MDGPLQTLHVYTYYLSLKVYTENKEVKKIGIYINLKFTALSDA